jgi:Flp pilus assembly protein TadD
MIWICVSCLLAACSASRDPIADTSTTSLSEATLLAGEPLVGDGELKDLSHVSILEVTPGMQMFLKRQIGEEKNRYVQLRHLLFAVVGDGQFDLIYDESTRTAEETFRVQRGNCLSFTNMFIAMARHIGLRAEYQEVEIPPVWSTMSGSILLSQHVNVLVNLDQASQRVVDFNMSEFDFDYDRRVISDQRARAHYFSNIGVERMLAGDSVEAFMNFRQSLMEDRTFSPAWGNLGILYRREGYAEFAEAAFFRAMYFKENNLVAMSNLASLYEEQGDTERAEEFRERVARHRMSNPYYRFQLAQSEFESGEYESAIKNLEFAIDARENEDRFYSLMSMSYLMKGDREEARKWMERAEEIAVERSDKRKYNQKLEMLMQPGPGDFTGNNQTQ